MAKIGAVCFFGVTYKHLWTIGHVQKIKECISIFNCPVVFKYVHRHHHLSHAPTPLAAFSFHPLEAIIEFGFMIPVLCILPVHFIVLFLFAMAMTVINVLGHLGYELFPKTFLKTTAEKFSIPLHIMICTITMHMAIIVSTLIFGIESCIQTIKNTCRSLNKSIKK